MKLNLLIFLLVYWTCWGLVFHLGGDYLGDNALSYNTTELYAPISQDENVGVGLWATALSFGRFAVLTLFGIGLGASVPVWFQVIFGAIQTMITLGLGTAFLISCIWDG